MTLQDKVSPALKKESHQRVQRKEVKKVRTLNPLVIFVVKMDTLLMYAGVRRPVSRTNPRTRVIVTNAIRTPNTRLQDQNHKDNKI